MVTHKRVIYNCLSCLGGVKSRKWRESVHGSSCYKVEIYIKDGGGTYNESH